MLEAMVSERVGHEDSGASAETPETHGAPSKAPATRAAASAIATSEGPGVVTSRARRVLRDPRAVLAVCALAIFTDVAGSGIILPAIPEFAGLFGASEAVMGYAFSTFALAFLLSVLPLGRLVGATGRADLVVAGGMLSIVAAGLCFVSADTVWVFVLGQAFHGVGSAGAWVAGQPLAARMAREKARSGLWFSAITVAMGLGLVLGPLVGAIGDLRTPFVIYMVLAAVAVVAALVVLPGAHGPPDGRVIRYRATLKNRQVMSACLAIFVLYVGVGVLEVVFPLFMDLHGSEKGGIGVLFFWLAIFLVGSQPLAGRWMDRIGPVTPAVVALAAAVPLFSLAVLGTTFAYWMPVFMLLGIATGVPVSATMMIIASAARPGEHAAAYALWNFSFSAGYLIGPAMGGALAGMSIDWPVVGGLRLPFFVFSALALVSVPLFRRLALSRPSEVIPPVS